MGQNILLIKMTEQKIKTGQFLITDLLTFKDPSPFVVRYSISLLSCDIIGFNISYVAGLGLSRNNKILFFKSIHFLAVFIKLIFYEPENFFKIPI